MKLSLIICTYNPNYNYLSKCLEGIQLAVSKLNSEYEIILIDNNSNNNFQTDLKIKDLLNQLDISVIFEGIQGLTNARLKGISIAKGDYILFIDDDNVIDENFLIRGIEIAKNKPFIGSFSGNVELEFEENPAPHLTPYLGLLVCRNLVKDVWSNQYFNDETMPCGAGLWIKREVAAFYLEINQNKRRDLISDRIGDELNSGGDNDLSMCAIDIGLGMGLFKELRITHLISRNRVRENYLLKLNEGIEYSATILRFVRNVDITKRTVKNIFADILRLFLMSKIERRFFKSSRKGRYRAIKFINNL
jgi:glycosyltransferase involved in cell wall biosynthesis